MHVYPSETAPPPRLWNHQTRRSSPHPRCAPLQPSSFCRLQSLTRMTRWSGVLRPSSSRTMVYDGRDDLRSGLLVDEVRLVRISSNCRTCGSTSITRCRAMWWAELCTYLASSTPAVSVRRRPANLPRTLGETTANSQNASTPLPDLTQHPQARN
jgi:hypothetical protein